ncbi:hypothetical protein ACLB2K_072610 [Fragaria x ananassa]
MLHTNVRPDSHTFPSVINACAALCDLEMGLVIHRRVSLDIGVQLEWILGGSFGDVLESENGGVGTGLFFNIQCPACVWRLGGCERGLASSWSG